MSGQMHTLAKSVTWQDPSKSRISFTGPGANLGKFNTIASDVLSMACTGIQLAEITSAPIEEFTAEEWRFAVGRLENYQVQIGFKDFNNFTLYKIWASAMQEFLRVYPDDQKFNIEIEVSDDFGVNKFTPLVHFKDCILTAVSGSTLDNSAIASVAEFSITAKCSYVDIM